MQLNSVEIFNFKGIEHCKIELKSGFNLIIGENGKGKTSILEAMAVGLGGIFAGMSGGIARNFSLDEVRTLYIKQGDGGYLPKSMWPCVQCEAEFADVEYSWTRKRDSVRSRTTMQPRELCHIAAKMAEDSEAVLPIISYQSPARVFAQKREKTKNVFQRKLYYRTVGYIDCLAEAASTKMILNWCARMEQISWQKDQPIREYEAVKAIVGKAMSILEEKNVKVVYDKQAEEILYQNEDSVLPISSLSAGYQSFIWMLFDIAYRMAVLNPMLKDSIQEATGIVLIDEIDMHLHPRWQWKAIEACRVAFPNIQFVATTHSPIIIASAKKVWCIDITKLDNISYGVGGYGLEVNDALQIVQKSKNMPAEIQKMLNDFYQYIDENQMENAKNTLKKIEDNIGENVPAAVKARATFDLECSLTVVK